MDVQNKLSLLIVDDSRIMRRAISRYLSEFNITIVGEAADGEDALQLFSRLKPELVTLDITMPEPNGITVLEKMLQIDPTVKVLVITALTDKATAIRVLNLGACYILHKPLAANKLQTIFKRLIGEKQVEAEAK